MPTKPSLDYTITLHVKEGKQKMSHPKQTSAYVPVVYRGNTVHRYTCRQGHIFVAQGRVGTPEQSKHRNLAGGTRGVRG